MSRVDVRAALCSALDVPVPDLSLERVRRRAALQGVTVLQRRVRSMLAAATLIVVAAAFAGGSTSGSGAAHVASVPAPAPVPLST